MRRISHSALRVILDRHGLWLENDIAGIKADLREANLSGVDLREANLSEANLREANLDMSAIPLSCGSLRMKIDNRLAIQLLFHALKNIQYSDYVDSDLKSLLLTPEILSWANQFHRPDVERLTL